MKGIVLLAAVATFGCAKADEPAADTTTAATAAAAPAATPLTLADVAGRWETYPNGETVTLRSEATRR